MQEEQCEICDNPAEKQYDGLYYCEECYDQQIRKYFERRSEQNRSD